MFKAKNKKPFIGDNRITLDAKHNEMVQHFRELQKSLPKKEKQLKKLQSEYNELKKIPKKDLNNEQLKDKYSLADSINNLINQIEKIENSEEESNYFLQAGHILYKYYDNIENIASSFNTNNKKIDENVSNVTNVTIVTNITNVTDDINDANDIEQETVKTINSVIDFFSGNAKPQSRKTYKKNITKNDISDYVTTKENFQRADIRNDYLKIIDPDYIGAIHFDGQYDKCDNCNSEKTLIPSEGIFVCEVCGETELIVIDSDRPSYKDPQLWWGIKSNLLLLLLYNG